MIVDFSVENFLSIQDRQTISFEPDSSVKGLEDYYFITLEDEDRTKKPLHLLKIGMVYGANAAGKSNVLKSLSFLQDIVLKVRQDKNVALSTTPFMLDYSRDSKMEINFVVNKKKYNYKLEFNRKNVVYEELNVYTTITSKKSKKNIFIRNTNEEKQITEIKFDRSQSVDAMVEKQLNLLTLWNETTLAGFSKISADIEDLKLVSEWFDGNLLPLLPTLMPLYYITKGLLQDKELLLSDLVSILQRADFNITDLRLEQNLANISDVIAEALGGNEELQKAIEKELLITENKLSTIDDSKMFVKHTSHNGDFTLPFGVESEGTKKFFGLAGVMMYLSKTSKVMLIDELDSSLHPELYEAFITTYLKNVKKSQLLFTTQNREFLQKKEILRKDALWIAKKNTHASTELYSFADFDSSVIRNTTSFYNVYSLGKLGGVPNVPNDLLFYTEK